MDFVQYKCPCCGSTLTFSPETQNLSCKNCDNEFELSTIQEYDDDNRATSNEDLQWEYQKGTEPAKRTEDGLYLCPSCGAKIEADEDTVSTICPYCENVVVIKAAADGEFKPDIIIPFQVTANHAREMLDNFCKGKRLLPKNFRKKSYLKNLKGYYVPYWLFDCDANANMSFNATKTRAWRDEDYNYIDTSYYLVSRSGQMCFHHVPVDGSTKMDDAITESLEPFDYNGLKEFHPAYLAGYETDKYDVKASTAEKRAKERLYNSAEELLLDTIHGYDTVNIKRRQLSSSNGKAHYALLPIWLFETVYEDKTYQFAINGQTGKMVGELPIDNRAFWRYLLRFTGIGTIVLSILGIIFFGGTI